MRDYRHFRGIRAERLTRVLDIVQDGIPSFFAFGDDLEYNSVSLRTFGFRIFGGNSGQLQRGEDCQE